MSGAWVIIEGPDGAGKTTLAQKVVAFLTSSTPTVSQHLHSKSDFEEYYTPPRMWRHSGLSVVQDRCAVSDLVYSPVLRGIASQFGENKVRQQLRSLTRHAVVIFMTADEQDLAKRLSERGDDLINESMLHALCKNYWREMSKWRAVGAHMIEFDTSGDQFPDALEVEFAIAAAQAELEQSWE
jgi:thymidylate kinase